MGVRSPLPALLGWSHFRGIIAVTSHPSPLCPPAAGRAVTLQGSSPEGLCPCLCLGVMLAEHGFTEGHCWTCQWETDLKVPKGVLGGG